LVIVSYRYVKKQSAFFKVLKCLGHTEEQVEESRKKIAGDIEKE